MVFKKWSNWLVFFAGIILALIVTPFLEPLYKNTLYSGGGFSSFIVPSYFDTYPPTFFLLYTFFITFFYKAFSKNFKPLTLVYFLAFPFLLFISSLPHLAAFAILLVAGLIFGKIVSKAIHV